MKVIKTFLFVVLPMFLVGCGGGGSSSGGGGFINLPSNAGFFEQVSNPANTFAFGLDATGSDRSGSGVQCFNIEQSDCIDMTFTRPGDDLVTVTNERGEVFNGRFVPDSVGDPINIGNGEPFRVGSAIIFNGEEYRNISG